MSDPTRPDAPQLVEVTCPGCGETTTFSPRVSEDRIICPVCAGLEPTACCEDCE